MGNRECLTEVLVRLGYAHQTPEPKLLYRKSQTSQCFSYVISALRKIEHRGGSREKMSDIL
jgi:hypothetical protein